MNRGNAVALYSLMHALTDLHLTLDMGGVCIVHQVNNLCIKYIYIVFSKYVCIVELHR